MKVVTHRLILLVRMVPICDSVLTQQKTWLDRRCQIPTYPTLLRCLRLRDHYMG